MKLKQKVVRNIVYYFCLFLLMVVRVFPYKFLSDCGAFIAHFIFTKFLAKNREIVQKNLALAFPNKTIEEIKTIENNFYQHLGRSFFEFLKVPYLSKKKFKQLFSKIKGMEHILKARSDDKAILLLSGHIGNWELMGAYLASTGLPVNVVAKKIYDERLNDLLLKYRSINGVRTLMREEGTKDMIRVLKNKECLGILIDQDTNVRGIDAQFFGKIAKTPVGATILAQKYSAVVLPIFTNRIGKYQHMIEIEEPIELTGDLIGDTQKFNNIIENRIIKFPAEWVWLHKRWQRKYSVC
ncbi:MAG: lysophospholipid acyltransferase family protein [bacterium]|nr:lysophospholipid acyltransferase family protein [bacterium]